MKRLPAYDVFEIPIESIVYDEDFNCRSWFTTESVESLAKSMHDDGLLFPIILQPDNRIVCGHRRFKAAQLLKWPTIKATFRKGLTPHQAYILNLSENIEQRSLNILEEAVALKHLYPNDLVLRVASEEIHKPTRWVHIRWRLLSMPEEVQQQAAAGMLSALDLEALVGKEPDEQTIICRKIVETKKNGHWLTDDCKRKFRCRQSKEKINLMIMKMMNLGIRGLAPRALAWAASQITTEEFLIDIDRHVQHGLKSRATKYVKTKGWKK